MKVIIYKNDIVYVDMDGVLVQSGETKDEWTTGKLRKDFFLNKAPVSKAVDAFKLFSRHCNVYILSTPVWDNVYCWSEKRMWVERHLGSIAKKKLILTHNKALNKGVVLIDDSLDHGAAQFDGHHIHFGTLRYSSWAEVIEEFVFKDDKG
jgi:5'-nucleotidase